MREFLKTFGTGFAAPMEGSLLSKSADIDAVVERHASCPVPSEADALFARILAGQPISLFLQDHDFMYVWLANMHSAFTGAKYLGNNDINAGVPESIYTKYLPIKQEVIRSGKSIQFEEWEVLPDGSNLFISVRYDPYLFPDGRIGVLCRMIDLSKAGEANLKADTLAQLLDEKAHELKQLDERFMLAMEEMPILFYIQDENLNYVWVKNFVSHYSAETLIGRSTAQTSAQGTGLTEAVNKKLSVLKTGRPERFDMWLDNTDGSRSYLQSIYLPYPMPNGKMGLMGKVLDLTSQKLAEEEVLALNKQLSEKLSLLQDGDEKLDLALKNEPIIFFIQDENLRFIWVRNELPVNDTVTFNAEALMGKTIPELGEAGLPCLEQIQLRWHVIETGESTFFEGWITLLGEPKYFRYDFTPYDLPSGKRGVMGKLKDLTPQKLAERDLLEANQALMRQNRIIESQLEEAREMQLSMLPRPHLETILFRYCADMQTCLQVGGDYYDYTQTIDGGALIALGDATGHGVKSGIIVSSVKAFFKLLPLDGSPAGVLATISEHLAGMKLKQAYMGLSLLKVIEGKATYAAAGMPPIFVYRKATGQVETLAIGSIYLGTSYPGTYREISFEYSAGDMAVMLSDGYTEMRNGQGRFATAQQLSQCIASHAAQGCKAVVNGFRSLQTAFLGGNPLYDDATIVAVEFV